MPMLFALALAAAVAVPKPGAVKTFKDWTVACDNVRQCTAVGLMPEDEVAADDYQSIVLRRGPLGGATVSIEGDVGEAAKGSRVELFVDGAMVQVLGAADKGGGITGNLSVAALVKMVNGGKLELRAAGKPAGSVSLAGFAAAMRYWDALQLRDGSPDAIVVKGRTVRSLPPPPAPRVVAAKLPPGKAAAPSVATIRMLAKKFGCEDEQDGPMGAEAYPLGAGRTLIFLPCGAGAYNFSSKPVIASGSGKAVTYALAPFDLGPDWGGEAGSDPTLVNAGFDAKTATLSSYAKGRGPGDCGTSQDWVWDGARFRLTEMREMHECRGSIDWMRTWTATVAR